MRADLARAGWSFDNDIPYRISWADVVAMVKHSPPGSAVFQAMYGEAAAWTVTDHLLAGAVDALRTLLWIQSADGHKNRNRPKPIERPGEQRRSWTEAVQLDATGKMLMQPGATATVGAKATMTPEEFAVWWNQN